MFDFFRKIRVPAGPHEYGAEIDIERPAAEVYALLDPADRHFAKRQLGEHVAAAGRPDTWEMILAALPDVEFTMTVSEREPGRLVAFETTSEPRCGRLERSEERYEVIELGPDLCRVELSMTATFQKELPMRVFQEETVMLSLSVYNALAKTKILAEEGIEAVWAADGQMIVGIDDLNCGQS